MDNTLVPHARDMAVAAMTDSTLAVLNVLSGIVLALSHRFQWSCTDDCKGRSIAELETWDGIHWRWNRAHS